MTLKKSNKGYIFCNPFNVRLTPIAFDSNLKTQLILLFSLFLLLFIASLYFLVLFMDPTVLFQLTFTFIYNTFNKKFSVSVCPKLHQFDLFAPYYSWTLLHFLVLFMNPTVLFQLTFTFIYNTFSKKFLVSIKYAIPDRPKLHQSNLFAPYSTSFFPFHEKLRLCLFWLQITFENAFL